MKGSMAMKIVVLLALALSACAPKPAGAPAPSGGLEIPNVVAGKFNVAAVLIGPHDDGGWSQAHYEGLLYVEKNVPNTHVAYIENVPEGADSEQVFRSLARKGFNLILGTSFGYMDPMAAVAEEFPDTTFVHISGYKSNMKNFGNLFGAMEDMKYLAGMVAGSRAKLDGNPKLGYMAPSRFRKSSGLATPSCLVPRRLVLNAPWTCDGSTPGTIQSARRTGQLRCSMPARKSC